MHPVIRLMVFMVFTIGAVLSNVWAQFFSALILLAVYIRLHDKHLILYCWQSIRRMRWLFFSILVVYFWFTPGERFLGLHSTWMPSIDGVQQGILRVSCLVLIITAVNILIRTMPREQLIAALIWLLQPLKYIGFPTHRFAIRTELCLRMVEHIQSISAKHYNDARVKNTIEERNEVNNRKSGFQQRIAHIVIASENLVQVVEQHVRGSQLENIECPILLSPSAYQWAYPVALGMIYFAVLML